MIMGALIGITRALFGPSKKGVVAQPTAALDDTRDAFHGGSHRRDRHPMGVPGKVRCAASKPCTGPVMELAHGR